MGDRRMVEIKTSGGSLYLYSHWGGSTLPKRAVEAILTAEPRIKLNDEPYALRIIVDQLTKAGRDQETGFGLMLKPFAEDEYNGGQPSIIIDLVRWLLIVMTGGKTTVEGFSDLTPSND